MALPLLLWGAPVLAADSPWVSPEPGQVQVGAHSGFPWHGVDATYAPRGLLAVTGELETARFRRTELRLGLQRPWRIGTKWSLSTAASVGGVHQVGGVPRQGPQAGATLSISRLGRVEPYLSLFDRELFALRSVTTQTSSGDDTVWTSTRFSTRGFALGSRIPVRERLCLDLSIRAGSVDDVFAIPSLAAGLTWRSEP